MIEDLASPLVNEHCCIKQCWGVYEQNSIVNSVRIDDWTAKWAIITGNESYYLEK